MTPQTLQTLAEWCDGRLLQGEPDDLIRGVSTDSRSVAAGQLFVALQGENFDAHYFLASAAERGCTAFLISRALEKYPAGGIILVKNTLQALQALAAAWRKVWGGRVLGLTGSNGKTSTKDLVASVLGQAVRVRATEGNLNNHIGLPLTMLAMDEEDEIGVVEMGMNHPGEIAPLAAIAAPDAVIITNIGTAHIEFMGSREAIALEKGMLAEAVDEEGCVILNADDDCTPAIAARTAAFVLTAGFSDQADVRVSAAEAVAPGSRFLLHFPNLSPLPVRLPVPGRHMVGNAALAAAAGYHFGLTAEEIITGLESASLNKGRLQMCTVGGLNFVDDSYNANPDSMRAALETMLSLPCRGRRILVLGRMGELGIHAEREHRLLGELVASMKFPLLCTVGDDEARLIAQGAAQGTTTHHFSTHAACGEFLRQQALAEDLILLKGSRSSAMEKILTSFS